MLVTLGLILVYGGIPGALLVLAIFLYLTREQRRAKRRKKVLKKAAEEDFDFMTKREREYAKKYLEQNQWMKRQ